MNTIKRSLAFVFIVFSVNSYASYYEQTEYSYSEYDPGPSASYSSDYYDNSYYEPPRRQVSYQRVERPRFDDDDYEDGRYYYHNEDYRYASTQRYERKKRARPTYSARMPQTIANKAKVIIIDPRVHAFGAYSGGKLLRSGIATSGAKWCPDIRRPCKTKAGYFTIKSLGSAGCKSTKYPLGRGGAPMPYCMFFNGHQGLHGSYELANANLSHGCVRISVDNARWIRFNFATIGTPVIVRPY